MFNNTIKKILCALNNFYIFLNDSTRGETRTNILVCLLKREVIFLS